MKKIFAFLLIAMTLLYSNSCKNNSSSSSSNDYEVNKMSLEDQEKDNPLKFLSTNGTYRGSLFGSKVTLEGTITNSATIATFKDVVIKVHYYSQTNTEIESEKYVIYDYFPPHKTKEFKIKVKVPGGTSTIGWDVSSASVQ